MNLRRFLLLTTSLCALVLSVSLFAAPLVVHAQPTVDAGLAVVGQNAGLSAADPRVIAARVINIALGFVGIIMVCIMVYAGFLWMTAGGNQEQVERAQKYIRNAIIGVIIIVSSWAITTFVINKLLGAVGGGGGGVSSGSSSGGGDFGTSGGAVGFQVRSITPNGSVPLRNVEVRFLFTRDVQTSSVTSSIKILRARDNQPVDGSLTIEGGLVTFMPRATCPAPAGDRHCFEGDTDFIARVERSLRSNLGQSLACGTFAPACEVRFHTGDRIDTSGPRVFLMSPVDGQSLPQNDSIRVRSRADDDSGVSYVESFVNGRSIGRDGPSPSSTLFGFDANILWDTRGLATGTYRLESRAFDIDSNSASSSAISIALRPRHCFNNVRDDDETGLDCGGSSCGACSGSTCARGIECAGAVCDAGGRCVDQPIITGVSPGDGRPGTFVTISGLNFGTSTGQVMFGGRPASAPEACVAVSTSTLWNPFQAIVAVPEGATTSSISLLNRNSSLSDTTADDRGPRIPDFRVNNVARPGLCGSRPNTATLGERGRVDFLGINLGARSDRVLFDDREFNSFLEWNNTSIGMSTPIISSGRYSVMARVAGIDSNSVGFTLYDRVLTDAPVIDGIDPGTAAVGEMVTLVGRNFGDRGQVFFRNPTTGAVGLADTTFPDLCRNDYWRNNSIIVKVPRTLRGGLGEDQSVRPGAYEVFVRRDGAADSNHASFTVTAGPPGPSVCAVLPSIGPVNTRVTVVGERFGVTVGSVNFAGAASGTTVAAALGIGDWNDGQIRTQVPVGAGSGLVRVTASARQSNGSYFRVANCREDAAICGVGSSCCADGSCSVEGVCPISATSSQFAWRASTGRIILNPAVVDECNNELPPSPSPRGNGICVNAQVVVRFTTHIKPETINDRSVVIRRCTGTTGDPCASGTPEVIAGRFEFRAGTTQDHLVFTPGGSMLWNASSTYEVILKTGIRSSDADGNLPMLENALRYGTGNAYSFRFTTRPNTELCRAGSVSVDPYNWFMEELGQSKEYALSPRAEGDICVQLNGDTMGWNWSVSDRTKAAIADVRPPRTSHRMVTGIGATMRDPVLVTAELTTPTPPAPVRGSGRLSIRLAPPRVEAYAPNCDEACVNAAIWARFNVPMDLDTLYRTEGGLRVPNIVVKRCVNESCREFDSGTVDLSESILTLEDAPGYTASSTLLKLEPTYIVRDRAGAPVIDSETGLPTRATRLDPERYYKVWILGGESGIRSEYGSLLLTNLNENDPLAFSWKFRVRGGTNPRCSVDRIAVAPGQKYESEIGARQMFSATPISAPDTCSRDGQMLITERPFRWSTSAPLVADFALSTGLTGRGSLSLAATLPVGCNDRCTNAGSQAVYGEAARCGDSVIQTADPNYCRRRSDSGRLCEIGSEDCVTRFGDPCRVLPPTSMVSEECDNGGSNGPDNECTSSCLWNRQRRVTDLSPGTCGNGTVQRGEQCDPGRVCVGGTSAGTDCTRDASVCGTAGTCTVTQRHGCSIDCQALGSRAGGSTCGNNDVADGETCDNRIGRGAGCSSDCLHLGSSALTTTICGNGIIEPGETCEVSSAGDRSSRYCQSSRTGGVVCDSSIVFSTKCDVRTCLNLGTTTCARGSDANCCGNGRIEPGEDCDGGAGCSARCLALGSSPGYRTPSICGDREVGAGEQCDAPSTAPVAIANRQLFEITGLREPTAEELRTAEGRMASTLGAEYDSKRGEATYGVQCSFTSEASCTTPGTGLTTGGCCAQRPAIEEAYPSGSDVCRNALISARFNQLMDERSVSANFIVAKNTPGVTTCASGTSPLNAIPPVAQGWRARLARTWSRMVSFFTGEPVLAQADLWCIGTVRGDVTFEPEDGKTRVSFILSEALEPGTQYRVVLRGETDLTTTTRRGVRSFRGVRSNGDLVWNFTTGNRICTVDQLSVYDQYLNHPFLFYRGTEAHRYIARAVSIHNGAPVPISPIPRLYAWSWTPWISTRSDVLRLTPGTGSPVLAVATTTAQNKNGSSYIGAGVVIDADTVNTPSTVGRVTSDARLSTVMICENPWTLQRTATGTPRFIDDVYNFATTYCKDYGQPGFGDDLPDIIVNTVPTSTADTARGILRQYFFSFDRVSLRGDGIGIRVLANPLHLSPKDWYVSQGFAGSPQSLAVDGYEAVKDGDSVYVGAINTDPGLTRASTNIYLISRNPDAGPEATSIFDQLVTNLSFNTNLTRDIEGYCKQRVGGTPFQQDGRLINCSADWECLRYSSDTYCANAKAKMQRDLKRINDFQYIGAQLEAVKGRTSRYPTIASGSFLQTFVSSRWPSWQAVLGSSLGASALPQDPLNVNLSCGVCLQSRTICMEDSDCPNSADRCLAKDGFDPATCWNAASSTFMCPQLSTQNAASVSRQYQYQALAGGERYQLATELEQIPATAYQPSLLTEIKRCVSTSTSNGRLCDTDADCNVYGADRTRPIASGRCNGLGGRWVYGSVCRNQTLGQGGVCGDGIRNVASGEACELGQTQEVDCTVDGRPGRKIQICQENCSAFIDGPSTVCAPRLVCGNNRVDSGEVCDEGSLNGTYGHCNRTCSGYGAMCGDGQLSSGEICDNGLFTPRTGAIMTNGQYCDTSPSGRCDLAQTCSADCREAGPHCGDGVIQSESGEQCDGDTTQTTTSAVCNGGSNDGRVCTSNADCAGGACGGDENHASCVGVGYGLCAGGTNDGEPCTCSGGTPGTQCDNDSVCGRGNRCIVYPTRRTRACVMPRPTPVENQCRWGGWTSCRPEHFCGDGVLDQGEACDDGNRNDYDACTNRCQVNRCGDGFVQLGVEECDEGALNGQACTGADYGSTCSACTSQCRLTASSGGYCGDNHRNGGEQCDGGDLGNATSTLSCTSLGFDYAERSTTLGSDLISCNRTCSYAGCRRCSDERGTGVITGYVYDAVYSTTPVQGARVTLYQNGVRLGEQTTSATGTFSFNTLNERPQCSGYRIVVDLNGDNPLTPSPRNESINGGYWSYESNVFTVANFRAIGIENTNGKIFLIPRVGRDETLVVTDWNARLPSLGSERRYVDAHLILPNGRTYPRADDRAGRDVYYRAAGNPDLSTTPHANMFCFHSENSSDTSCGSFAEGPEVTLFKRQSEDTSGVYSYLLRDFFGGDGAGTRDFLVQQQFRVRIVTQSRLYSLRVPAANTTCNTKDWLVFQEDAVTGNIVIPGEGGRFACGNQSLPSEGPTVTPDRIMGPDTYAGAATYAL